VIRPQITGQDMITNPDPASDGSLVPLQNLQGAVVTLIAGTPSNTPSYPSTQVGDVVLAGVRATTGQVTLADSDLDLEVRDIPGKHSSFQQSQAKYDDRLRCYRSDTLPLIGVKPSQLEPPFARVFSYVNQGKPSIFPVSAGAYNGASGDSFVNMKTGAVTGADATTGTLAATVPTAGNSVVATLSLTQNDTLALSYGTQGSRAQCFSGIKNRLGSGAGSVAFSAGSKPISFVVVTSQDGTNVTELDIFDARGVSSGSTGAPYSADVLVGAESYCTHASLAAAVADAAVGANQRVIIVDSAALASTVTLSKAGWRISAAPGVTLSNGGAATGLNIAASGIEINRVRFSGFTTGIVAASGASYARVIACNFATTTTAVDYSAAPSGSKSTVLVANIEE
jgi:hypothetical protein